MIRIDRRKLTSADAALIGMLAGTLLGLLLTGADWSRHLVAAAVCAGCAVGVADMLRDRD
jgi:hypothetical protein